jgi:hypothetical protein
MNKIAWFGAHAFLIALILLGASLTFLAVPAIADTPHAGSDFTEIVAYVEAEMKAQRIPGLALAIVQGYQIVHLHGLSIFTDLAQPIQVDRQSLGTRLSFLVQSASRLRQWP